MLSQRTVVALALGGLVACSSPDLGASSASSTPTEEPTVTEEPTPRARRTAEPAPTPTVDPELALSVFLGLIPGQFDDEMRNSLADAIEADFYWIQSVDRLNYNVDAHAFVVEATVDYEVVYENDPQEWRDDTWTFHQSWATNVWGPFVDGFDEGQDVAGLVPDWSR